MNQTGRRERIILGGRNILDDQSLGVNNDALRGNLEQRLDSVTGIKEVFIY